MSAVRFIFALHNHQPVGNFGAVFEEAYQNSYLPFLEVMERYSTLPFCLHTSGPLIEWLVEHRPEYVERLRALVNRGQVEILGGGFYEPILTMIPQRDRIGQIVRFTEYLEATLGHRIRGGWVAERVWEQNLVTSMVDAGIEYTVLDDFHFHRAGDAPKNLFGYYLTEDEGRLLKVFPNSERMRYLIPWSEPHESYEYLRKIAAEQPGAIVVCADDGEKFGGWPETHEHIFEKGWIYRFCDMLVANQDWLETTTFSEVIDSAVPLGKVYLPDNAYREMTEWVLPSSEFNEFEEVTKQLDADPHLENFRRFLKGGGTWRNFKNKYAETDEMYVRSLGLSDRLHRLENSGGYDLEILEDARRELYRGQCNCPYWHGAFGGLYLPHLRNAIYHNLISCHDLLDRAERLEGPRVSIEVGDFNLDARQEVKLENDRLIAFVRPASGGHIYELDLRDSKVNLLATLDRRPEPYHATIAEAIAQPQSEAGTLDGPSNLHDRVTLKQEGLDQRLVYDRSPRKALVDHFFDSSTTLEDLVACRDVESGDFAQGTYLSQRLEEAGRVVLMMERRGLVDGHPIKLRKSIALEAGSPTLEIDYELEELPEGHPLYFAIELNQAAMAGHATDRYYSDLDDRPLGMLDQRLDLSETSGINLSDEWLDLQIQLRWSIEGGLRCFPIETASQSEGGFEAIYQSSAVIPHWRIVADQSRRWSIRITWTMDRISQATDNGTGSVTTGRAVADAGSIR